MQCTEAGVVIALRRRVERMRIPHERKESCLKLASIMASLVVTKKMCVGTVQLVVWEQQLLTRRERQIMRVHDGNPRSAGHRRFGETKEIAFSGENSVHNRFFEKGGA